VTIAAAWDPARQKDVVPAIVEIAIDIGAEMKKVPVLKNAVRSPERAY